MKISDYKNRVPKGFTELKKGDKIIVGRHYWFYLPSKENIGAITKDEGFCGIKFPYKSKEFLKMNKEYLIIKRIED